MADGRNLHSTQSSFWRRRTVLEKRLFVCIGFGGLALLALAALRLHGEGRGRVCLTEGCVRSAAAVLATVDLDADPCADFYRFACGGFARSAALPDYRASITSFQVVEDAVSQRLRSLLAAPARASDGRSVVLAKNYYQACMNTSSIQRSALPEVRRLFRGAGGFPAAEGARWDEAAFDWKTTLYAFRRVGLSVDMLFAVDVATDQKNSSRNLLTGFHIWQLDQPHIPFGRKMAQGAEDTLVKAYLTYITRVVRVFGAEERRAALEMSKLIELYSALAKIVVPPEDRRNPSEEYNPMTVRQLEEKYNYAPWLEVINVLLAPAKQMGHEDIVVVTVPSYFEHLGTVLETTAKRTLANYMFWSALKGLIDYMGEDVRALKLAFAKLVSGESEHEPRWKECAVQVANGLDAAVGSMYVRHFLRPDAKGALQEMVRNIRGAFVEALGGLEWMDDGTRAHAVEKANAMHVHMACPDELFDGAKVDAYYGRLHVGPGSYLGGRLNVTLLSLERGFAELDRPFDRGDWRRHAHASVTNAFYEQSENSIEFPAGILQGVFFGSDRPHYLNYGAIGYIIGHEITHGFDDMGRQYDKDGNLRDWWQNGTGVAFQAKAQCIVDQYSNLTVAEVGLPV